jgi:hypothetical protein
MVLAAIPFSADATLIYRFEPTTLQVPSPEFPQTPGLQAIDAEIGIADAALTRLGELAFSDLEYARFSYTPLPDEFGTVSPGFFELGLRFGTNIVPALTEFDIRTGYASWDGVMLAGENLLFNSGASLSVANECFNVFGQIFCEGDEANAFLTSLDAASGLVELFIRDNQSGCNEFVAVPCLVEGRFVLADVATEIPEPPVMALVGLMSIGIYLRRRAVAVQGG